METLSRDFLSIISLINLNLKWIGLEFNPDKGPPRVNTSVIILGSAFYMSFLVHRLSETNNLALASQMMFHLPWMLQYSIKAANMYLQYPLAKDFMRWARNTLREHHPEPFVEQVMKEAHFRCLKVGKSLVSWNIFFWKSPIVLYIIEWMLSDEILLIKLTENDAQLSPLVIRTNVALQIINGLLINCIALGYNAFVFSWCIVVIYRVQVVSRLLEALQHKSEDQAWTRSILKECHRIHVETIAWRIRFEQYVNVVGVIEMATSTIMICFLLYLCLSEETRTPAAFVIMATAVYQSAVFCVLGEQLSSETTTMRNNLYNLNWYDLDRENRQLMCMILVASTPDASVKLGSFKINLESFAKFLKVCFSFCAVLRAA